MRTASRVGAVLGGVFGGALPPDVTVPEDAVPLHIGDTWRAPVAAVPSDAQDPDWFRYAPVAGLEPLRHACAARLARTTGAPARAEDVLIAAGATGALQAAVLALVDPGQTVAVLSPAWPLFGGMVRLAGGKVEPVVTLASTPPEVLRRRLDALPPNTVALYLNTPNNPTGDLYPEALLAEVVRWARARDAWILSDETYDVLVYEGAHRSIRALAPERTVVAWTFSKAYGMAGLRVGVLLSPACLSASVARVATFTAYCAPRTGQGAALAALEGGGLEWLRTTRAAYAQLGEHAASRLGVASPPSGTFLFLDARELGWESADALRAEAARQGVLLAPGASFGPFPHHVRLCFTSAPPDAVRLGVARLAALRR